MNEKNEIICGAENRKQLMRFSTRLVALLEEEKHSSSTKPSLTWRMEKFEFRGKRYWKLVF